MATDLTVLMESRGFIRVLQALAAISSVLTTACYSTVTHMRIDCKFFVAPVEVRFGYPFRYFPFEVPASDHPLVNGSFTPQIVTLMYDLSSSPKFFVACGVFSFVVCLSALAGYVLQKAFHKSNQTLLILDLGLSMVFAVLWFAGSCAWEKGVSDVKYYMNPQRIIENIPICAEMTADCTPTEYANYTLLNVSVLLGFTSSVLWAFGTWLLIKEMAVHHQKLRLPVTVLDVVEPFQSSFVQPPVSPHPPVELKHHPNHLQQPQY